jgi:hypothetical protein
MKDLSAAIFPNGSLKDAKPQKTFRQCLPG